MKRLFPLQPAWQTQKLRVGDILLKVSGVPLTGLTLRQSLDILRTSPARSTLTVCRVVEALAPTPLPPPAEPSRRQSVIRSYSYTPATEAYCRQQQQQQQDERDGNQNYKAAAAPSSLLVKKQYGEFTVELTKVNGSLGFTLNKHAAGKEKTKTFRWQKPGNPVLS